MGLKRAGSTSNVTFFITAFWALLMIAVLVSGHLVLGFLAYAKITGSGGIDEIAKFTDMPTWTLWLSIVAALVLDGWIVFHDRKDRKKALKR
jgi:hypothetical protein